jgi:hypothetical protein
MPTPTYNLITSGAVTGSPTSSISFLAIPQTYKHLHIRIWARSDRNAGNDGSIGFYLNSNAFTGTDYMNNGVYVSSATTPFAQAYANTYGFAYSGIAQATQNANFYGLSEFWIPDYTGTTNKNYIGSMGQCPNTAGTGVLSVGSGYTKSTTAAVSSIYFRTNDGSSNFVVGTKYYLYGVN